MVGLAKNFDTSIQLITVNST